MNEEPFLATIHILYACEVYRQADWQDVCFLCIVCTILFNFGKSVMTFIDIG